MLVAEIRRKLMDLEELDADDVDALAQVREMLQNSREDLLTADVFGALKYLPRIPYLAEVLRMLETRNPDAKVFRAALQSILKGVQDSTFSFWPTYSNPEGTDGSTTQPDVELQTSTALIFVESKLHSTFGKHQIERQLLIGLREAKKLNREFFLVLITSGIRRPYLPFGEKRLALSEYLQASARSEYWARRHNEHAASIEQESHRVLWLSWQSIMLALDKAAERHRQASVTTSEAQRCAKDMISDLSALMAMRQLLPFRGITIPTDVRVCRAAPCFPFIRPAGTRFKGIALAGLDGLHEVALIPGNGLFGHNLPRLFRKPSSSATFRGFTPKHLHGLETVRPLPAGWMRTRRRDTYQKRTISHG